MRQTRGVLVVLLLLAASAAFAQERPLEPGERVRLKAPRLDEHTIRGRVVGIEGSALILDAEAKPSSWDRLLHNRKPPDRLRVPLDAVASLEVARGKKSNWLAAIGCGATVGAGSVLLAGAAMTNSVCPADDPDCSDATALVITGIAMTAATTVVYGLFAKTDRWIDVTPAKARVAIAPTRGRGVAVALSVRF